MDIHEAQRDVRLTFLGGFPGQLVSGILWLSSAALYAWVSARAGIVLLLVGGMFIFPATLGLLRLMGRPAGLPRGHPMNALGRQVALALPLGLPVALAAAMGSQEWLYPAVTVLLGAHYLPFAFLYGMRMFVALAGVLVGVGVLLGMGAVEGQGAVAAWVTGVILIGFALLGRWLVGREMAMATHPVSRDGARRA